MSCSKPIFALRLGVNPTTGKEIIKILPKRVDLNYKSLCFRYGKDNILMLPCGKCSSCIEAKTKSWAARCVLEASQFDNNCFLTLTYNEASLPKFGLCKKDLQNFIKRLRKKVGFPIRYYCCGEYGENTKRPHYHCIIFNWFPEDAKFLKESKFGGLLYTSKILSDLWPFGISSVGEVSFASCAYVARYCQKKVYIEGQYKAFSLMSLKPGIGEKYFRENILNIYTTDKVYFKFGNSSYSKPSRYFDKLLERLDPKRIEKIKKLRVSSSQLNVASEMLFHGIPELEIYLQSLGTIKDDKFQLLKRKEL